MKVGSSGSATGPSGPAKAKPNSSSSGFAPGGAATVRSAGAAQPSGGVAGVGALDALIALQAVDDPLTRRRRAVGRAGRMLDLLDAVKLSLLGDPGDAGALGRLAQAVREERAGTDDPELETVLDEIETRAAVELAKREAGRQGRVG